MRKLLILAILTACATAPATQPNDKEWNAITNDYQWIETLRKAQPVPPPTAPRKQQIELLLDNHKKLEVTYIPFMDKAREYYERTADPRAAKLLAREKVIMGDEYLAYMSRYDRALEFYRLALQLDPSNTDVQQRIAMAEERRFVSMNAFAAVKTGMKEDEVRRLTGLPREDWIKQVVQNNRVYSVWIFPKADGGASAIYFDNGVVYHTNWSAAAPQPQVVQ